MTGLHNRSHPLRDMLDKELQQRTFPALTAPCRLCQFMLTVSPASRSSELSFIQQLARSQGSHFSNADNDINLPLFGGSLRFEKHGEFSSYVFIQHGSAKQLFDDPLDFLPTKDWLDDIPGQIFRVVQLSVITPAQLKMHGNIDTLFNPDNCISSLLAAQKARIWTDFQKHAEGAGRMLLVDHGLSPAALGRLVQQLFDLGNYRKLSLLGWPLSRQALAKLTLLEQQLSDITQRIEHKQSDDERLLNEITTMAAQTEHLIADTSSRLQATAAYYQLTLDRIKSLNETPIEGLLSLQDFSERRLTPAFRTSESVVFRQNALSGRLGRSTELLRTRINLKLEQQNQQLLASMDRRAKLQLNMQQMVEGLSLVAISYYAVQLAEKAIKALGYWLPQLDTQLWQSVSVPVVIVIVAAVLMWVNRQLHRNS
ncbi:MAG: hypothetical protein CL577_00845 [Alteromonadaceae bacterium]|jgi:uncharacterized membrane-anchored protein|uniref:DUF3422 family protein n=1 Tax=Rheinheimera aquimaris TaxID=412437 RepID=UPI000C684C89|nr:DUF3422 domain-containing protein [Rheinheimera aquimaris]MBJ91142.1 hypothetical protein [Alteromonadaceae bacterium]MCD1598074.1 DUF3422 domain-containing protein [Rheinheimera aquimaris]HBN89918.1 DUF3422 domain-containing protein [Rheinheimera sp.]|tara:strand:+ start:6927 stop:8204 length:1278 start_codon:yes stop_codon:yes gene_type:complete